MEKGDKKMKKNGIPDKVLETLKQVSEKRGIELERIIREYKNVLSSEKVQRQKGTDEDKKIWAGKIVFSRFMTKEPTSVFSMVVPIGITEPRLKRGTENKVENMRATMFAAVKNGKKFEVKEIVFNGKLAALVQKIKLLRVYQKVKLYDRGYFIEAGEDTKFDNPQKFKMTEEEFLTKICKFPKLSSLRDMITHTSKYDGGYIDRTDMYLIEGLVRRGFKKGYAIKDESLPYEEEAVKIEGNTIIVPQTITVWIPSRFYRWDEDSELAFLGTIDIGKNDRKPFMNAVLVYPVGFVVEFKSSNKNKGGSKK